MLPRADIWSSAIKRHFPPVCEKTAPITIDCNCQSFPHCNTADCRREVPLLCLSSPPSACVARHPSDVGLIHYIRCVPHTHRWRDTEKRERRQGALFILCRLWSYLFSEYVFHFVIPLWFPSISSLWSQFCSLTKVTSKKKIKNGLSLFSRCSKSCFACQGADRGGSRATACACLTKKKTNSSYQFRA